jgi:3-deoxy-D-manno-octulosonate 8-phosphate phosphatase KdsC-like HAD superfamily phosphatase
MCDKLKLKSLRDRRLNYKKLPTLAAQFVSKHCGGNGAVREFAEWVIENR